MGFVFEFSAPSIPLFAYGVSYLALNVSLAFFFWANPRLLQKGWTDAFLVSAALRSAAWKLILVMLLCAMAGLPPFHSFVLKVSVLAKFAQLNAWASLGALVLLLFCSWYAYQTFAFRALNASSTTSPLKTSYGVAGSLFLLTAALALAFGFCFLDDALLLAAWLS